MRTNLTGESATQPTGKPRHMGAFGRRDLTPDETIRLVKERFRICSYLFRLGGVWVLTGGILVLVSALVTNGDDNFPAFAIELIGLAIFTSAFAMTLAIYRCPVCDKYLSRFRPDKLRCPQCDAQVKEAA